MSDPKPIGGNSPDGDVIVSIIVATYNSWKLLADCLESIYRNPPSESYEIIVVDDASRDNTTNMVRACFPEVRLLTNEVNRQYAISNNLAIKMARGRYLYFLNNDTIMLPHALDRMLAFLREHPRAGAVGSKLLNEDGSIQWSVKPLPSVSSALFGARSYITRLWPGNPFSRHHLLHLDADMTKPFVAGYVSGASVLIPREVQEKVGDLDDRMFYHVDADYGKRTTDAGYDNWYLPTATVIHLNHKGGSMVHWRRRLRSVVEFHRGSYIYYQKHIEKTASLPMRVFVVAGLVARCCLCIAIQAGAELLQLARLLGGRIAAGLRGDSGAVAADRSSQVWTPKS